MVVFSLISLFEVFVDEVIIINKPCQGLSIIQVFRVHPSSEIVYYPANRDFLAEPESLVCKTMTIAISFPSDFLEHGMKFKKCLIK